MATEAFVKDINPSINCFFVGRGDSKDGRNEYEGRFEIDFFYY